MKRDTFTYFAELQDSQWWPREKLQQLQLQKLRRLVKTALTQTQDYAQLAGLDRNWQPQTVQDLQRLPLLDKKMLAANTEGLVNRQVEGGAIQYHTGGSTGEPLTFYLDKRRQAYDRAGRMLTHLWWGIKPGAREAYVWGSPIELSGQDRVKRLRDWMTNERLFSAFEIEPAGIRRYVERLRKFRPESVFGYSSSIAQMCQYAKREGLDLRDLGVKVVFSTAEILYRHQREIISPFFGDVPVVDGYGSREGGFIAHECPQGRMHVISENVIVEFINDGQPARDGEDAEIVITHLDNLAMPFIRYRTNDIGQSCSDRCPCGRGGQLIKVVKGRTNDFVATPDGRWLHDAALSYVIRDIPNLRRYQIVQESMEQLRVLLVVDGQLPPGKEEQIRDGMIRRMGAAVDVCVERVREIPTSPSGKFRYVISKVTRDRRAAEIADQDA